MKETKLQYMDLTDIPFIDLILIRRDSAILKDYDFVDWIDNELERRQK